MTSRRDFLKGVAAAGTLSGLACLSRPPNVIPAYSPRVLSDEKLKRIHEYLESIPEPPEVSTLPVFSEE